MWLRCVFSVAVGAATFSAIAQEKDDIARSLARAALKSIADGATKGPGKERLTQLGFASVEQAQTASLDQPIPEYYIPITTIRDFRTSSDPNSAIVDARRTIYPVVCQQTVCSGITLSVATGRPKVVGLGRASVVALLEKARRSAFGKANRFLLRRGNSRSLRHFPWGKRSARRTIPKREG
jgi:hypothetical protein